MMWGVFRGVFGLGVFVLVGCVGLLISNLVLLLGVLVLVVFDMYF